MAGGIFLEYITSKRGILAAYIYIFAIYNVLLEYCQRWSLKKYISTKHLQRIDQRNTKALRIKKIDKYESKNIDKYEYKIIVNKKQPAKIYTWQGGALTNMNLWFGLHGSNK